VTKLPKYYIIVNLLFFTEQGKTGKKGTHVDEFSQPIFGILVIVTKNEPTKIFNEPGINSFVVNTP